MNSIIISNIGGYENGIEEKKKVFNNKIKDIHGNKYSFGLLRDYRNNWNNWWW